MGEGENSSSSGTSHAVSVKPIAFTESSPGLWFRRMEAQFSLASITVSSTKFNHALASLPSNVLENVPGDVLDSDDYESLKASLLCFYEQTKPELFSKLISTTTMTGRPSVYLRELQQIASKVEVGEDLIRHQFVKSLPSTISPVVAAQKSLSLTQLGSMADELMPLHSQINTLSSGAPKHPHDGNGKYKRTQVEERKSEGITFGLRPFFSGQRPKICRGHLYYANQSRTCKPWCKYPNKGGCTIKPSSRPPSRSSSPSPNKTSEN